MRFIRSFLAALVALAALGLDAAEPVVDGPRARFDDPFIATLEGRWDIVRQIRGTEVRNTMTAAWALNHQFMRLHMKDVKEPPAYEAIVLIGYVHATKEYVAHWTDTFGGRFSAVGRGKRAGDSIEFRFDYPDGPFYNTFTWQPERKGWVLRMEGQDASGARKPFALDTLTRVAADCPDAALPAPPEVAFGPERGAEALIVKAIGSAKTSLRVAAFAFSSPTIVKALVEAKKRGVDVQAVVDRKHNTETDPKRIGRDALAAMATAGIPARTNGDYRIHHDKFIVVDACHVQTGSWNYAESANRNSENVVVLWNNPEAAAAYLGHWESRFAKGAAFRE
ncbi:MAG: phospholipase D family protein [Betaproteobacteria bacterium]|nr:phospholipase D family protein [Betaproteobacteria bacterium]